MLGKNDIRNNVEQVVRANLLSQCRTPLMQQYFVDFGNASLAMAIYLHDTLLLAQHLHLIEVYISSSSFTSMLCSICILLC